MYNILLEKSCKFVCKRLEHASNSKKRISINLSIALVLRDLRESCGNGWESTTVVSKIEDNPLKGSNPLQSSICV